MGVYSINARRSTIAPMEGITRQSALERVLAEAKARIPATDDTEAHFRFGKPATFTPPEQKTGPTVTTTFPDDGQDQTDAPPEAVITDYDEIARKEETIRVENPDDAEQYVMVKRCTVWLGQNRRTGDYVRLNFKYDG